MTGLMKSSKLFAGAAILFALASLYNFHGNAVPGNPPAWMTVGPASRQTIQSGPAVEPRTAAPARS
jgi:hypothetical protein